MDSKETIIEVTTKLIEEKGENYCKDYKYTEVIEKALIEAYLIVMVSPAYVFHTTGAMKVFLDHFAYRWMSHRPLKMFRKRAMIITQCLGMGAKSAAKDIKDSLSWWGISSISVYTAALVSDISWDKLSVKKRNELKNKIREISLKYQNRLF